MTEAKTGKVQPLQRVLDKRCRFELLLHLDGSGVWMLHYAGLLTGLLAPGPGK